MIVGAVLVAAGILARRWARATGDVLIAIGALPLTISIVGLDDSVLRVVAVATLPVIIMAALDAADAASLAGRAGSARRWLVALATAAATSIAGLGMGQADAAPVVVVSVMAGAALLAILAVLGHRRRRSTT
jgi:MYXO-CTERM domain-containing protein